MGTGLGDWSVADIVQLLKTGIKPDFDDVQGSMAEVIGDSLKHLSDDDLKAIAREKLEWLNRELADGRPFISGERLSLADLVLYAFLDFASAKLHGHAAKFPKS